MEYPAMKLATILSLFLGSVSLAHLAQAETIYTQITPEKTGDHLYDFTIEVERLKESEKEGEFLKFKVTAQSKNPGGAIRNGRRTGKLEIFKGEEFVSSADVQSTPRDGALTFSFRVTPKYAAKSRFTFAETPPERPGGELGEGFFYGFALQDFAKMK
jgi:hypothetical protein